MDAEKVLKAVQKCRDRISQNIDTQNIKASGRTQKALKAEQRGDHIVMVDSGEGAPFETLKFGRNGINKITTKFTMSRLINYSMNLQKFS